MLILATVFALTLPALSSGAGTRLKASARTVAAGLRQARSQAIFHNRDAVLEMDLEKREFRLGGGAGARSLPEEIRLSLFTARSEQIDERRGRIRFFADGSSTGGRITLANDAQSYLVDVDWLTGRVRVREGTAAPLGSAHRV